MVTSTSDPRLYRIEFEMLHDDFTKTGIVCILRIMDTGIQLYYWHHLMYSRSIPKGPWTSSTMIQQPLNAMLKSTVMIGVVPELWSQACLPEVKRWPGELGRPIEEADLGL